MAPLSESAGGEPSREAARPALEPGRGTPLSRSRRQRRSLGVLVPVAIVTLLALAGYVGFVFVPHERAAAISVCRTERESAAESRKAALQMWVEARLGDAANLAALPSVRRMLSARAAPLERAAALSEVSPLLTSLVASHGAERALVLDSSLRVAASDDARSPLDGAFLPVARAALESRVARVDMVRRGSGEVDVLVARPVLGPTPATGASAVLGVVFVIDDPSRWL